MMKFERGVWAIAALVLLQCACRGGDEEAREAFERFRAVAEMRESMFYDSRTDFMRTKFGKGQVLEEKCRFCLTWSRTGQAHATIDIEQFREPWAGNRRRQTISHTLEKSFQIEHERQLGVIERGILYLGVTFTTLKYHALNGHSQTNALSELPVRELRLENGRLRFMLGEEDDRWTIRVTVDTDNNTIMRVEDFHEGHATGDITEYSDYREIMPGYLFPHVLKKWDLSEPPGTDEDGYIKADPSTVSGYEVIEVEKVEFNIDVPEEFYELEIPNGYRVHDSLRNIDYVQGRESMPPDGLVESIVDDALLSVGDEAVEEVMEATAAESADDDVGSQTREEPPAEGDAVEEWTLSTGMIIAFGGLCVVVIAVLIFGWRRGGSGEK